MKINKIYQYLASAAMVLAMPACTDSFLDQNPDERVNVSTEEQVLSLMTTAYSNTNYGWMCELSSDNMIDNNSPHVPANEANGNTESYYNLSSYERMDDEAFRFDPIKSSTGSDSPSEIWGDAYRAIATANHALEFIGQIAETNGKGMTPKLKAARAEALLVRAYHHFVLVNIFSMAYRDDEQSMKDKGIPYITKPEKTVYVHEERGTVTEVYNKIKADLEEGLKDVTDAYYDMPKWRFNVAAAHAFAARFYLFHHEYEKCVEHANAVLGSERDESILSHLMHYKDFDDITGSSEYAHYWQSASLNNNLLLIATNSRSWRRFCGYRYSINGVPMREINYRRDSSRMPTSSWTIVPAASVSGGTYYRSNSDYGYMWAKVGEQFEYTDKVAGIGYAHVIRREFTGNLLLLERAEAELMLAVKTGEDKYRDNCFQDLYWFEESRHQFSEANTKKYFGANGTSLQSLTVDMVEKTYFNNKNNVNCKFDWNTCFQRMSAGYSMTDALAPYMNVINDYRRWETSYEGHRFFDLKRWGIEYSHVVGYEKTEYKLTWNDPRRAFELPQEVIAAGLEQTRPVISATNAPATLDTSCQWNTEK